MKLTKISSGESLLGYTQVVAYLLSWVGKRLGMGPFLDSADLGGNFGVPFEVDAGWLEAGYRVLLAPADLARGGLGSHPSALTLPDHRRLMSWLYFSVSALEQLICHFVNFISQEKFSVGGLFLP